MHHAKNTEIPLALLSRILYSTIMRTPHLNQAKGSRMIVLYSIVDSKDYLVSTIFHMEHPILTSPFIQLNDYSTCFMYMKEEGIACNEYHKGCYCMLSKTLSIHLHCPIAEQSTILSLITRRHFKLCISSDHHLQSAQTYTSTVLCAKTGTCPNILSRRLPRLL